MAKAQVNREPLQCLGNKAEDSIISSDIENLTRKRKCSPAKVRKKRRILKLTSFFPIVDKNALKQEVSDCVVSELRANSDKENIKYVDKPETSIPNQQENLKTSHDAVLSNSLGFGCTDPDKTSDTVEESTQIQLTDSTFSDTLVVSETKENSDSVVKQAVACQGGTVALQSFGKRVNSELKLSEISEAKQEKTSCIPTNHEKTVNSGFQFCFNGEEIKLEQACLDKASFLLQASQEKEISKLEVRVESSEVNQAEVCQEKNSPLLSENFELQCSVKEALPANPAENVEAQDVSVQPSSQAGKASEKEKKEGELCVEIDSGNASEVIPAFEDDKLDLLFDDWPLDEIAEEPEPCAQLCLSEWQRCVVTSVSEDSCRRSKELQLRSVESGEFAKCRLQGVWRSCEVNVDDIVSAKAQLSDDSDQVWVIDNDVGFLVHLPDILLSPTAVVGSIVCSRQGVLNYLFSKPDFEEGSKIMVVGILIHEMLQQILTQGDYSPECIAAVVEDVISSAPSVRLLYSCRMSLQEARSELLQIVPSVQRFCSLYALSGPAEPIEERPAEAWQGSIGKVLAVEDNYCIPQLGLKGKIDVTVLAKEQGQVHPHLMPLEVKTGQAKNSVEHRGQVILYCLMASQVTPDVDGGLLVYLREGFARKVQVGRPEQRDIILLRNRLARYVVPPQAVTEEAWDQSKGLSLPHPVKNTRACKWCPHLTTCAAFERAGRTEGESMGPAEDYRSKSTVHLTPQHIDYVIHWTKLLWLEASESKSSDSMSDLWCVPAAKRMKRGRCLVDLRLEPQVSYKGLDSYHHVLRQSAEEGTNCQLRAGEMVVLSTHRRIAVASGFIAHIDAEVVTLDLSRDLTQDCTLVDELYIVDAYEVQSSLRSSFGNLAALLDDTTIAGQLRQFVIDHVPPAFDPAPEGFSQLLTGSSFQLNDSQLQVILKALSAQNYLLVKGLPGCGKSTTVAALVKLLVTQGCSVLVTAHTHSAVDTVLQKLIQLQVPFLRLGTLSRLHPSVHPWTELQLTKECTTPEQLDTVYKSKLVVATTCMGMRHPLFTNRSFDVCIVDESTQVLQPVVLGPLLCARKFILVGDPDQLPPVTRSKVASRKGLTKCLFSHLDKVEVTVCLDLQYRMNQRITELANHLTYKGRLKCGSPAVASATLQLHSDKICAPSPAWIERSLSCKMEDSVVFIHVPGVQQVKKECINVKEAGVVQKLVETFLQAGQSCDSIGVMSPYRDQVAYLRGILKDSALDIETNTVDQYQGRDKDVVIFCCTNNWGIPSSKQESGGILSDQRRLTVAVTRARHKLVLLGNSAVLEAFAPIKCILKFIGEKNILPFDS